MNILATICTICTIFLGWLNPATNQVDTHRLEHCQIVATINSGHDTTLVEFVDESGELYALDTLQPAEWMSTGRAVMVLFDTDDTIIFVSRV